MGIHCNAHINNLVVKSEVFQRRLAKPWLKVGTSTYRIVNHNDIVFECQYRIQPFGMTILICLIVSHVFCMEGSIRISHFLRACCWRLRSVVCDCG